MDRYDILESVSDVTSIQCREVDMDETDYANNTAANMLTPLHTSNVDDEVEDGKSIADSKLKSKENEKKKIIYTEIPQRQVLKVNES